tara:strand:+ start:322 stop:462 length:141 start_codon:yes stop_codon:yes gene_type:complete
MNRGGYNVGSFLWIKFCSISGCSIEWFIEKIENLNIKFKPWFPTVS